MICIVNLQKILSKDFGLDFFFYHWLKLRVFQLIYYLFIRCTAHGHILTIMAGHVTGFIGSSCGFSRQVAPHALM